jgi:hypothetical protein
MLDVNNERYYIPTPYQIEKMKNLKYSMSTSGEMSIEKTEEGRINFQNKCVSSQKIRMRKEEGAAVDSSAILPYLSSAGSFVRHLSSGRTGSVLQRTPKSVGKSHKIPKMSY